MSASSIAGHRDQRHSFYLAPRRPDGKELFYISSDNWLMTIPVTRKRRDEFGTPRRLFHLEMPPRNLTASGIEPGFDVSADGQRFLISDPRPIRSTPFVVIQNWQGLLNQQGE